MSVPYHEPPAAVDLAEGGVPDGVPGPANEPPYRFHRGRDLLRRQGQAVDPGELALFDAADRFREEFRQQYPRCAWLHSTARDLKAALRRWQGVHPPGLLMFDEVVAGSRILPLVARAFLMTCARKRDCYTVWQSCQNHLRTLCRELVKVVFPEFQNRLLNGYRVVALIAGRDRDTCRSIASDDYIPDIESDNSQNDDTIARLTHRQERREVHHHRRLAAREYSRFSQFVMAQPGGAPLLVAFRADLQAEYVAGLYPSPPVDPVGEALPDPPLRDRVDDDSSVEDLFDDMWEDEMDAYGPGEAGDDDFVAVGQGVAGAPPVYELVVGGVSALGAVAAEPDVGDSSVSSDMEELPDGGVGDIVSSDMEDLF